VKQFFSIFLLMLMFPAFVMTQDQVWTMESDDFTFKLPKATWKVLKEGTHLELIYGDRQNGFLRIRNEAVDAEVDLTEFARNEADTKLRFHPGFVGGKDERFTGRLSGITSSYEYTSAGKPMAGRIYYLRAGDGTVYILHFTGLRDALLRIRNQTDAIARSFELKNS
jgi:hypothetical protein